MKLFLFAFLAVSVSAEIFPISNDGKLYIVRHVDTDTRRDLALVVEMVRSPNGEYVYSNSAALEPVHYAVLVGSDLQGLTGYPMTIRELPIEALFHLANTYPDVYPKILPALLCRSSPEEISKKISVERFNSLTDAHKRKISQDDYERLAELYNSNV